MERKKKQEWMYVRDVAKKKKKKTIELSLCHTNTLDNALTHESSCRLAEPITDAERLRVRRGVRLHLLGSWWFINVQLIKC